LNIDYCNLFGACNFEFGISKLMEKKVRNLLLIIVAALVVIGGAWYLLFNYEQAQSTRLAGFAQCVGASGAKFYGAFWCPHCQDEKKLFGDAAKDLPYVECSTPDTNGQLQVCQDQGIQVYPTWKFADGSKVEGEISLQDLAQKTGCQLPQ
jgi:thiol-disulfide isomerase/thioredoxin